MTKLIAHAATRWPPIRRAAWFALFAAILSWSTMVDPNQGVSVEPLPLVGWVGV